MSVRALAVAVILTLGMTVQPAAAKDPASLGPDEVRSLQQRLRDAGCYKAELDGKVTPALAEAVNVCPSQQPVLRITSPVEGTRFSGEDVTFGYELRSPSGTKVRAGFPDRDCAQVTV